MNKPTSIGLIAGAALLVLIGISWIVGTQQQTPSQSGSIIAQRGIHWHPSLAVYVGGEKIEIPQNIGVGPSYRSMPTFGKGGMAMTAVHTHDDVPVLHLEFSGVVTEDDIRLGNFFRIWGKDMRSMGSNMRMTVNGTPNTLFEDYVMRDGDKIELHFD